MNITIDEILVYCMARQIKDGELVAQGLATPLVTCAYLLALRTHAPQLYFSSAIGQGLCREPAALSITNIEALWLDKSLNNVGFVRAAVDILPSLRPKEFFRPAQVDVHGNFNNVAIGKNYLNTIPRKARLRLPGTGGIPDVTTFSDEIYLYVTRHSRVTFVPELDIRSGLGYSSVRKRGSGPKYLVSDLGQFNFENGKMRLISYHPGVQVETIIQHTGFVFEVANNLAESTLPGERELQILREEIDPLGIRKLEFLSGIERRELLYRIISAEKNP